MQDRRLSGGRPQGRDGLAGLAIGLAVALALHAVLLPALGLYFTASDAEPRRKTNAQLVRLSKDAWDKNKRIELELQTSAAEEREREKKRRDDDDVEAPGQVVALPPPEREERPDIADHASEWNQRTERETVSRDQRQHAAAVMRRLQRGELSDAPASAEPSVPAVAPVVGAGPRGPGRSTSGDSGTDAKDGAGNRLFALEVPKQAARAPLQLQLDVDGVMKNQEAVPETPGNGDRARIAMGNTPADRARRSGSGGAADDTGQGLRGGGNDTPGLPTLEQLTPSPRNLARLSGAPANDHLPEVEVDAETRLNAWRWKHATFFNRIADAIRREWQGGEVLSENDPGGRVYGFEERMTVVQVTLDRSGKVLDVNVAEPSGAYVLDDEAVRAFKEAGPFANPPPQLFKGEDRFTFLFGFNVAYNRTNFDLNWRPN